jgi:MFS superfamily sulfate permease-like transporter
MEKGIKFLSNGSVTGLFIFSNSDIQSHNVKYYCVAILLWQVIQHALMRLRFGNFALQYIPGIERRKYPCAF